MIAIALVGLGVAGSTGLVWNRLAPPLVSQAPAASASRTHAGKPGASAPQAQQARKEQGDGFVVKRILPIEVPFRHGDYVWDDEGVPDGPTVITVDLAAQTLSIFRGGYEIGAAVIIYGDDDKPTPLGHFRITEKDADHVSNLYDAPMPYMLRLTNDGITIHGTDDIQPYYASNGCVGVPNAFAKRLFEATKLGDLVIITKGKRLDMGGDILRN